MSKRTGDAGKRVATSGCVPLVSRFGLQEAFKASISTGVGKSVLLVDHEDSFVHTLGNYLRQTGAEVCQWLALRLHFVFRRTWMAGGPHSSPRPPLSGSRQIPLFLSSCPLYAGLFLLVCCCCSYSRHEDMLPCLYKINSSQLSDGGLPHHRKQVRVHIHMHAPFPDTPPLSTSPLPHPCCCCRLIDFVVQGEHRSQRRASGGVHPGGTQGEAAIPGPRGALPGPR